jgi:hypothetical protein
MGIFCLNCVLLFSFIDYISMKKFILFFIFTTLFSNTIFTQNLTLIEQKIVAQINDQLPQTEAILKKQ